MLTRHPKDLIVPIPRFTVDHFLLTAVSKTDMSEHLARRSGCQIISNLDDFEKNGLDELKLIVGECAPKSRSSKS